jgi:alpha-N-arabinofuranosidase
VDSINTFEAPRVVAPRPLTATVQDGKLRVTLEPKSVSVLGVQP